MKIVTETTQAAIIEMVGECFKMNRYLDRFVSVLGVDFACNESSNLIHHGISHWYPIFADELGEKCLERYNISVKYLATPSAEQDWSSVVLMMEELESKVIEFQMMLNGALKVSWDAGDLHVFTDLTDLIEDHNEIVEQVILLKDKIHLYGEQKLSSFDAHIKEHFWILKQEGDED